MGWLNKIVSGIKKASHPNITLDQDKQEVRFKIESETCYTLPFSNMESHQNHSPFTHFSESISGTSDLYGHLYLESVQLDFESEWKGSPAGFFEYFLKQELRPAKLEIIKRLENRFVEMAKFSLDSSEVGVISISYGNEELFIFDQSGKLFNSLLEVYGFSDSDATIQNPPASSHALKSTLVAMNPGENFFGKEDD